MHTLLAVDDGAFVSLLDPPDDAVGAVGGLRERRHVPGARRRRRHDVVLSSPIILYDHPEVAPESPGDLYDATEIDEILALRVLTLTDEEKAEARGTDPRAAAIVDRMRRHAARAVGPPARRDPRARTPVTRRAGGRRAAAVVGARASTQSVDPWTDTVVVGGVDGRARAPRVRLRPSRRADAHDMFLAGMAATVAGVFRDVDGEVHVAVTVDDDPATEALAWQGRYLYFHPDEIEPLAEREPP